MSTIRKTAKGGDPAIDDMNEAIAIFDGWEKKSKREFVKDGQLMYVWEFKYHKSWEALMPIVEKISKIKLLKSDGSDCTDPQDVCWPRTWGMPTEDGKQVMVRFNGHQCHEAPTLIEAVYMAVYSVIEFYNQQTTTNESKPE